MPNPASAGLPNPASYLDLGNGAVRDNLTCLVWEKTPDTTRGEAAGYCASLGLNGHTWRIPSVNELATLVDEKQASPAINRTVFPDTPSGNARNTDASGETGRDWFWASHHYLETTQSWGLNFEDGYTEYNSGAAGTTSTNGAWNYWTAAWVKCVR
jgi:hypothetical protein